MWEKKLTVCYGKSQKNIGKSTISMAMFNSLFVCLPEGIGSSWGDVAGYKDLQLWGKPHGFGNHLHIFFPNYALTKLLAFLRHACPPLRRLIKSPGSQAGNHCLCV